MILVICTNLEHTDPTEARFWPWAILPATMPSSFPISWSRQGGTGEVKLGVLLGKIKVFFLPQHRLGIFYFPIYVGNGIIIPTDEVILFRGVGLNHPPENIGGSS